MQVSLPQTLVTSLDGQSEQDTHLFLETPFHVTLCHPLLAFKRRNFMPEPILSASCVVTHDVFTVPVSGWIPEHVILSSPF